MQDTHDLKRRCAAKHCWLVVLTIFAMAVCGCDSPSPVPAQSAADTLQTPQVPGSDIRGLLQQAVLSLGETTLRPLRVREWSKGEIQTDDLRLQLDGKSVIALDLESGQERWRAEAPFALDDYDLQFADGVMYVAGYAPPSIEVKPLSRHDGRITRLRLADGAWLEPLQVPLAETVKQLEIDGLQGEVCEIYLLDARAEDERSAGVIAFSQIWNREGQLQGYVVTRFDLEQGESEQDETKWSKLFQYSGDDQSILKQLVGGMPLRGPPANACRQPVAS